MGVDREINKLGLTVDEYMGKIITHLRGSDLSEPLKTQVLTQIDTVTYRNYTIIRLKVPTQKDMSFLGEDAYVREGSQTIKIEGKKLVAVSDLFKRKSEK